MGRVPRGRSRFFRSVFLLGAAALAATLAAAALSAAALHNRTVSTGDAPDETAAAPAQAPHQAPPPPPSRRATVQGNHTRAAGRGSHSSTFQLDLSRL